MSFQKWEDVLIHETIAAKFVGQETQICGMGMKKTKLYHWIAVVSPQGWDITTISWSSNRTEHFNGATFNLPLEVVTAIRRAL